MTNEDTTYIVCSTGTVIGGSNDLGKVYEMTDAMDLREFSIMERQHDGSYAVIDRYTI